MAYTKTQIWTQIDAQLGTGFDITGPEFNTLLKNVYESLEKLITDEVTARSNADSDLENLISDEAALRFENDNLEITARSSAINAEATARQADDEYYDGLRIDGDNAIIDIINNLSGYRLMGVITPGVDPDPNTPWSSRVAWIASDNGTYNFLDEFGEKYVVDHEIALFLCEGATVIKQTVKIF